MATYSTARKLALVIIFLKESLRERGRAIPDSRLAELLNEAQVGHQDLYPVDGDKINRILNARFDLEPNEESGFIAALQLLIDRNNLNIDVSGRLPQWVEDQFSKHQSLRELLREPMESPVEGDMFGELANIIAGAWHFFYISPIDRRGRFKREIRSIAIFIKRQTPNSKFARVLAVSKHGCWNGYAFVNDSHLYMTCTDRKRPETAFFITNRPTKSHLIVGAGTALERIDRGSIRPVAGITVFGEKFSKSVLARLIGATKNKTVAQIEPIIERAVTGEEITEPEISEIQDIFCEKYDMKRLKEYHPTLFNHLQLVKINNKRGIVASVSPWLYIGYP